MKKQGFPFLVILTIIFAAFTLGYHFGASRSPEPVSLSVPASLQTQPPETTVPGTVSPTESTVAFPIDINLADKEEFMALPGIGEVLAQRILAYRQEAGPFSRVEDLLNVEGIGEKRFEDIFDLITTGG